MSERAVKLSELASVIRSKNAGPFTVTLDVFFDDERGFEAVRGSGEVTREAMAELYQVEVADVLEVSFFAPAHALKITLRRWIGSAAPGDTDVFGAQQHAPLLDFRMTVKD
jgi:hypothetical protein